MMISTHKCICSDKLSSFHQTCFILLFLQGRKKSQVCSFSDSSIHPINPYLGPYLPSMGLDMGIYRWVIHVSFFEAYTKQREAHSAIYRWILWMVVGAEKDKFIWFRWYRREEYGSFISGPQRTQRKIWW